jgi:hypothetical protein
MRLIDSDGSRSLRLWAALYIATGRNRGWRVTQFTTGVFSVSFVGGIVLTIVQAGCCSVWSLTRRERSGT